jgi:hypothetical protein
MKPRSLRLERLTALLVRLERDERGQDLVEYMLLGAFLGLTSYLGFLAIQNTIFTSYGNWDTSQQNLWVPPDPAPVGS